MDKYLSVCPCLDVGLPAAPTTTTTLHAHTLEKVISIYLILHTTTITVHPKLNMGYDGVSWIQNSKHR